MNRPGVGPQSLRGLPNGFSSQPQLPQPRNTSNRLPNGKMVSNGSTWAFAGGPMGSSGIPNARSSNAPMTSFAQTIGASQTGTHLDLSEFPSLSNNQHHQSSTSAQSTWAMPTMRNHAQTSNQRPQQSLLMAQQTQTQQQTQKQQDDLFSSSSQLPNAQTGFRFGSQATVGQSSQSQGSNTEEFPPLSRNINGEIGQDRAMGLLPNVGFGVQSGGAVFSAGQGGAQTVHNNGLLNALSSTIRAPPVAEQVTSPGTVGASRSSNDQIRQITASNVENDSNGFVKPQPSDSAPEVEDPLTGMSDKDRFSLKGLLSILKGPYADQAALISGIDITSLGFELNTTERLSDMIWSPWDDNLARPDIPPYNVPECYQVHNVQPIENKLSNFSDETLMFMFYSNPQDIQQMIAAQELTNRNWRYHKKLQLWLTKDDMMLPQPVNVGSERGFYIFFDPKTWMRDRREFLLTYNDLENSSTTVPPGGPMS